MTSLLFDMTPRKKTSLITEHSNGWVPLALNLFSMSDEPPKVFFSDPIPEDVLKKFYDK